MPVSVLHGEEDFLMERRVAELKDELVDPGMAAFNFSRLNNPDVRSVAEAALTLPFGQGKRMVLIADCSLFTKKRTRGSRGSASAKADSRELKEFEEALQAVSDQTYLIFSCPRNFDKTLKTSKIVAKFAEFQAFPRDKFFPGSYRPNQQNFCRKEANKLGATIDDDAVKYLLDSTEANLREIAGEIKKASIYVLPNRQITLETVALLSEHHSHVLTLMDHLACGRKKEAIECLDELLSRQSGIPLLAALNTTLSRWVEIKALAYEFNSQLPAAPGILRRELPVKELAKRIAAVLKAHPYGVEMDLKRLKNLNLEHVMKKRMQLTLLETSVKSGLMPDKHALTVFVTD